MTIQLTTYTFIPLRSTNEVYSLGFVREITHSWFIILNFRLRSPSIHLWTIGTFVIFGLWLFPKGSQNFFATFYAQIYVIYNFFTYGKLNFFVTFYSLSCVIFHFFTQETLNFFLTFYALSCHLWFFYPREVKFFPNSLCNELCHF